MKRGDTGISAVGVAGDAVTAGPAGPAEIDGSANLDSGQPAPASGSASAPASGSDSAPASAPEPDTPAATPAAPALRERDREILAFERQWWKHAGAKEQAIRDTFGLSPTRYYQILNGLLDDPAALAFDPVVVGRLRRLRSARARTRAGRGTAA